MKYFYHGENGITFNLFSDLNDEKKIVRFLKNMRWINKPKNLNDLKFEQIHLFPSFGRGKYGLGEPDAIIITNNIVFYVEVETDSVTNLPDHFFKQLSNFMKLGEYLNKTERKKIIKPLKDIADGKKVKGKYRTRKIIYDILAKKRDDYYIVITNDRPQRNNRDTFQNLIESLKNSKHKGLSNIVEKVGWIGFPSINRMRGFSKTKEAIKLNLSA